MARSTAAWSFADAPNRRLEALARRSRKSTRADSEVAHVQPEPIVTRVGEGAEVAAVDTDPVVDEAADLLPSQTKTVACAGCRR
jgi:hypothetical protein